jgi:RNA polymerase-binding transcription factor DksA
MAKKVTKKPTVKKAAKKTAKTKGKTLKKKVKTKVKTVKITPKKKAVKAKPAKKVQVKKTVTTKTKAKPVKKKVVAKKVLVKKTSTKAAKPKSVRSKKYFQQLETVVTAEERAASLKKIKGYGKKDLEHFKQIILEKRDEILEQLQNLKDQMLDPATGEYINENSPYSLHMAEQGTDAMEREKTFLYAQRENKFLGYLEDALKRIESGTYGICVECIDEPQHLCPTCPLIPKARLEAVPHSSLCLPMKQKQEKK